MFIYIHMYKFIYVCIHVYKYKCRNIPHRHINIKNSNLFGQAARKLLCLGYLLPFVVNQKKPVDEGLYYLWNKKPLGAAITQYFYLAVPFIFSPTIFYICVCMHAYMHWWTAWIHTCIHTWIHIYTHLYIYIHIYTYIYIYIFIYFINSICACTRFSIFVFVFVCVHMHIYMYISIHVVICRCI